jgi:nitroreductase
MTEAVPTPLGLTVDEVLSTTRAVRKRLDLDRPVPRATVEECAALAFQAPNGSNQQRWGWVCVDDPDLKRAMAQAYRGGMADHAARDRAGEEPVDYSTPAAQRMGASVAYLADHLEQVPVLLVPTIAGRLDSASIFTQASRWGSVLPAVWSFMLALRSRGLGSAWTTIHLYREREMAEILGIPYDEVTQAGLFPIAYTIGTEFKAADRSTSRVRWNRW